MHDCCIDVSEAFSSISKTSIVSHEKHQASDSHSDEDCHCFSICSHLICEWQLTKKSVLKPLLIKQISHQSPPVREYRGIFDNVFHPPIS